MGDQERLSRYSVEWQPDDRHLARVGNPRLYQHRYQSAQLELWEPDEVEWFVIIRTDPRIVPTLSSQSHLADPTPSVLCWHSRVIVWLLQNEANPLQICFPASTRWKLGHVLPYYSRQWHHFPGDRIRERPAGFSPGVRSHTALCRKGDIWRVLAELEEIVMQMCQERSSL